MVAVPAPGSEPKRFGQQQHQQMVKLFMNKMACSFNLPPIVNNPNNGKPITIDDAHGTVRIDIEYMMTLISFIFIYFTLVYLYYIVGKWVGNQGFVMVAVPAPGSEPKRFGQQQHQQMVKLFMNKVACSFIYRLL